MWWLSSKKGFCSCDDEGMKVIREEAIVAYFIIQPKYLKGLRKTSKHVRISSLRPLLLDDAAPTRTGRPMTSGVWKPSSVPKVTMS